MLFQSSYEAAGEFLGARQVGTEFPYSVSWSGELGQILPVTQIRTSDDGARVLAYGVAQGREQTVWARLGIRPQQTGTNGCSVTLEGAQGKPALAAFLSFVGVSGPSGVKLSPVNLPGLRIAPLALTSNLESLSELTLVDIRPQARFLAGHIPVSIAMSLRDVRIRKALMSKSIVIIGDGHDAERLTSECSLMVHQGFVHLQVLDGGIRGWFETGGPLEGGAPRSAKLFTLEASEALGLLGKTNVLWLRMRRSGGQDGESRMQIVGAQDLDIEAWPPRLDRTSVSAPQAIILFAGAGAEFTPEEWDTLVVSTSGLPFFIVRGGEEALASQLAMEAAIQGRRQKVRAQGGFSGADRGDAPRNLGSCCGQAR